MRFPIAESALFEVDEVDSTQGLAAKLLAKSPGGPGLILARHQTAGRGRFDRTWHSDKDLSLTMSLIFREYPDHPKPWLIGMSVACAAAAALHCQVQWPNDLVSQGRKLGGVLTEIFPDTQGRRTPVAGVGINLNQTSFPSELASCATSLRLVHEAFAASVEEPSEHAAPVRTSPKRARPTGLEAGLPFPPTAVALHIVKRLASMPEPDAWASLAPVWDLFDATEGKRYKLQDGRVAIAIGYGPDGELHATCEGEPITVLAADAVFGA